MKELYLPALTGKFGQWRYYQVVMKVSNIVEVLAYREKPEYRIKTVEEVEEIYSEKGVSSLLQRAFDPKRLEPLKKYILSQPDKYLNNLTVAIFGGSPDWISLDIKKTGLDLGFDDEKVEEFIKTFGIVKLTGQETLFVLDGQHRLKGLRAAVESDNTVANEAVSITFIIHNNTDEGRTRTRRLFSTINRYAKPVSLGENILLDEDDLSAIITRKLIEEYPLFKGKSIVALNKTADIKLPKDQDKFTTAIELWTINETLIEAQKVYPRYEGGKQNLVRIRPDDDVIQEYTKKIFNFWDTFFDIFPNAASFIASPDNDARKNGGPFSLRPMGQSVFCDFYKRAINENIDLSIIKNIPDNLSDSFWHYVMVEPTDYNIIGSRSHIKHYLYYRLGLSLTKNQEEILLKNYRKYKNDPEAQLPLREQI